MPPQKLSLQTFKACSCPLVTVCQEAWRSSQCSTATSTWLAERRWSRRTSALPLAMNLRNTGENGEVRPWQCSVHGVQEEILCVSSWLQKKPLKLCPMRTFFQRRGGKAVWWTRSDIQACAHSVTHSPAATGANSGRRWRDGGWGARVATQMSS